MSTGIVHVVSALARLSAAPTCNLRKRVGVSQQLIDQTLNDVRGIQKSGEVTIGGRKYEVKAVKTFKVCGSFTPPYIGANPCDFFFKRGPKKTIMQVILVEGRLGHPAPASAAEVINGFDLNLCKVALVPKMGCPTLPSVPSLRKYAFVTGPDINPSRLPRLRITNTAFAISRTGKMHPSRVMDGVSTTLTRLAKYDQRFPIVEVVD